MAASGIALRRLAWVAPLLVAACGPEPVAHFAPVPELGYRVVPQFLEPPPHGSAGEVSGVALDSHGHLFVFQRAEPMLAEYDATGRFVRSLGTGLFTHPHGLRIDAGDNLWTTDDRSHVVLKLDHDGRVLLVLGHKGDGAEADWLFNAPADVGFGPDGSIYVADGYGNSRVVKFDRDGRFVTAWGRYGNGVGEFDLPHTLVVDRQGRVYVGDRENRRIEVFDGDGRFITQWRDVGYPYGLALDADQHLWMADGGYDRIVELDANGKILGAFGAPGRAPGQFAWAHFLAIDAQRRIYVADVLNWRCQVFEPVAPSGQMASYVPTRRMFYGAQSSEGFLSHQQ